MLSRTADHLFWMARYIERAENTARMLDVALKTLLLPSAGDEQSQALRAVLRISELEPAFEAAHGEVTRDALLHFMTAAPDNPSSIYCCLRSARENARAVRGALTTEVWETVNSTWLEFARFIPDGWLRGDPNAVFEWVKFRSHLTRGVTLGTALTDESFYFAELGTFLERADNTARMLDVRFVHAESRTAPSQQDDFYYWSMVLGSVSGLEIYRKVYRDIVMPDRVVELLMLNPNMPRSLMAAIDGVCANLTMLRTEHSRDCERLAGRLRADLMYADLKHVLDSGLHAELTELLARTYALG
ncbi:MAG: alpha-E domain-containing protein, partial [Janthinobacterium lividum]